MAPATRRRVLGGIQTGRRRNGAPWSRLAEPGKGRMVPAYPAAVRTRVQVEVERGLDERHMAERLRRVADLTRIPGVVFLAEQPDVVAQREQPVEELMCLFVAADHVQGVGQPEAACQERALAAGQAVDGRSGVRR
jgi:hypothetical protein